MISASATKRRIRKSRLQTMSDCRAQVYMSALDKQCKKRVGEELSKPGLKAGKLGDGLPFAEGFCESVRADELRNNLNEKGKQYRRRASAKRWSY